MRYLVAALLFSVCVPLMAQEASAVEQPSSPFPFELTLFTPDSASVSSSKVFSGGHKATLVAFWLTTCPPCSNELDAYTAHYAEWQKEYDLEIVAVSMDFSNKFGKIKERLADKGYPFLVYWDRIRAFKDIMPGGLNGYPQVFLFDQKGQLVWRKKGYMAGDEQKMIDQVKALPQ